MELHWIMSSYTLILMNEQSGSSNSALDGQCDSSNSSFSPKDTEYSFPACEEIVVSSVDAHIDPFLYLYLLAIAGRSSRHFDIPIRMIQIPACFISFAPRSLLISFVACFRLALLRLSSIVATVKLSSSW